MEKIFVVKRVAEQVWATESAIDAALAETAKLMGGLVQAREDLKVAHAVTDLATSKIAESMSAMADARRAMIEAHKALDEAKLRIGVRTKMDGWGGKPWAQPEEPAELDRKAS
jgi:hypothetical protein